MPSPDEWDYDSDEWSSYKTKYTSGARHVHRSEAQKPAPRINIRDTYEHRPDPRRLTSEFLAPEVHSTVNLHRTRSQGHAPAPNVTIYNTTRMDNESSPNVRTEQRGSSADRGRQSRRVPGEWALEDEIADLRLEMKREARSRSRHEHYHHDHHDHSPHRADPRDYEDKIQLTLAQQRIKEAEDALERKRREDEIERREDLVRRKLEIKYIKDRSEREAEEDRIKLQEEHLKREWEFKREREERERDRRAQDEKEREKRIIAENRANMSREMREREAPARR
jgi:hypothetical protein